MGGGELTTSIGGSTRSSGKGAGLKSRPYTLLLRNAERQTRAADRERQQAAEQRQPGAIPQKIDRPERARREVEVQHHQERGDGGHPRPKAQDEREAGG